KKVSAILSPSPPLTIGLINLIIGKIKGAKVVYNVQEIYPDFLIEQGGLESPIIIDLLKSLERFVYNKSHAVTTIDKVFYETIVGRFDDPSKLHIIPNFVDTQLYKPLRKDNLGLPNHLFRQNEHVKLMYAGNIGHAQDWDPLLQLAVRLRNQAFDFYIIGEGVMKSYVESKVEEYSLKNVFVLPYQPRDLMPKLLAFSDLQYIFMSKEMEGHGFRSKVYTIMACAKPLLVCSGKGTPIINFLQSTDCACLVTEVTLEEKVDKMVSFLTSMSREGLSNMGQSGLQEVLGNYSKQVVVKKYVDLIANL